MASEQPTEKVYVTLDCLLDTRLGTLAQISQDTAVKALESNYFAREIDVFPGVSRQEFRDAYAKRNVDTLVASAATNVFLILQACVKGSLEDIALGGQNNGITFIVNYYPYQLEPEEVAEIRKMILLRTADVMEVEMVSVGNMFLTPTYCKENYAMMIIYDYVDWYEMHLDAIQKTPIPGVTLIAPALYHNETPNDEVLRIFDKENIHPFRSTEIASAAVISLKLLDVEVFCIDADIKPRKPKSSGLQETQAKSV
jgi:hypothetical protein